MKSHTARIFRFFSIILLFTILLAACAPAVQLNEADTLGKTAMNLIYDGSFKTVKNTWGLTGWLVGLSLGIALSFAANKFTGGNSAGCISSVIVFFFVLLTSLAIFHFIGASAAKSIATHALVVGSDTAKTRKANQFVEKLHIPAVKTVRESRECVENDYSTGCKYEWTYTYNYRQVCETKTDYDSEGNPSGSHEECHTEYDTRHVPYFKHEVRTYVYFSMPDEYLLNKVGEDSGTGLIQSNYPNMPIRFYTDWQAPEDYQNYLWGPSNRSAWEQYQLGPFDYVIPNEFKVIESALNAGRPYVITVWHSYVNWVFITSDTNNLVTTSSQVETYWAQNLLPDVKMIYSRHGTANAAVHQDYDFVQFKGGLQPVDYYGWQDAAAMYSLNVGPKLQGSYLIWAVPAASVDNPDALIQAGKAYLSDKARFGFYIAPKNLILLLFGVDESNNIAFCRMETGMPSGNVEIRQEIDNCPVGQPFTPQTIFGTMNPVATPNADGFYESTMEVPSDGLLSKLFAEEPFGFKRVKMGSMDWLKTDIKLDASDINRVIDDETKGARTASFWVSFLFIILAGVITFAIFQE